MKAFCTDHHVPWHRCRVCDGSFQASPPFLVEPRLFLTPSKFITFYIQNFGAWLDWAEKVTGKRP